ncbi:error-prone DNA polymerase [Pedobacter africanus]|uniref:Error-prone DNA polymerase n=1 Tax=Pedobacter africanus TaxID=151894 RepID=A0ACC6KTA4_9SPHI|nr:error-prone DNA polymerase [Pedobacter africanus]MDR6782363.1 error-prone DNA polymerase [Pedobacter africanus]
MHYTELQVTTNFSFLRGGSHPEELVKQAAELGHTEIAITDRNTLAGIVRAYVAAKNKNIRIIPACHLELLDGPPLLAYPTDRAAYARLSTLLSEGNLRTEKGQCHLYKADVYRYAEGMKFIAIAPINLNSDFDFDLEFKRALKAYRWALGTDLYLAASRSYQANDGKRLFRLSQLSDELGIPLVAVNDVHYHIPQRRELQDILTCIREKCTIYNAGFRLHQNAERHLKPIAEMHRLFSQYPQALEHTQEIAAACQFSLDSLEYVYPEELTTEGRNPQQELVHLTWQGAKEKFGDKIPSEIGETIRYELDFMERKNYAAYFLTVYDFVRFARSQNILCQGRGSAANSVVCYCLGITSVDPSKFKVLFARFMSDARDEPPDIDVDFEHERREEVMQYIYSKYGRDRSAIVATVTQVHYRGAVRDVAKVMGLSVDTINRLASSAWEFTDEWHNGRTVSSEGFDANDPHLKKVLELTQQYIGFPRQLGQHTGGFVMTRGKITDLCPILNARMENRTCLEWNKDDIEALGFLKVDVLALGMLTCIRKAFDLAKQHYGLDLTLANVPQDDPKVYEMISHADTLGVFQIESRAQMSMLPRLRPQCFYDLVIEVAIVRPGPIQGDMVHPYLRRRNGEEPIEYPSKELEAILGRTLGVPLFQEQAMEIAIVAAGFTPAEADGLRRSMATFKSHGKVSEWRNKLVSGMVAKGYKEEFAQRVFKQLEGFGSYGFPESHAASFALLVYISSWIKCHYPDVFATALLNSMPMGFYQPAQIVIDAQKHGVEVLPVDINHSTWDNLLEQQTGEYHPLRLGFRQVKGLNEEDMQVLVAARRVPFTSIHALLNAGISLAALERLADADAFRSIGLDRRQALWEVAALSDSPVGMFEGQSLESMPEKEIQLPLMRLSEHVIQDYSTTTLSLKAHPVSFVREKLDLLKVLPIKALDQQADGNFVKVSGLVLVRQRPGTATGVCFITIEDETGFANLVVFKKWFDKYRKEILRAKLLMVTGKLQREGEVTHVVVTSCSDLSTYLNKLTAIENDGNGIFHEGRNFK